MVGTSFKGLFLQRLCLEFWFLFFEVSMCRIYWGNLTNRLGVMLVLCVSHLGNHFGTFLLPK